MSTSTRASTSASGTTGTGTASCRFTSFLCGLTRRRKRRWVVVVYMLGSSLIISILSRHLGHHVYLAHVGRSRLGVYESRASGAHSWGAGVGELLATTR